MNTEKILQGNAKLLALTKKQKFIIGVLVLSVCFFFSEFLFGKSTIVFAIVLSLLTPALLYWAIYKDLQEDNFSPHVFVLPFFFSLSFGMFYLLVPDRFLTRIIITPIYALGLYALFRSQNIFVVGSIRTIALLAAARIVSFLLTILSYIATVTIIFSLHQHIMINSILLYVATFLLSWQSLWTITMQKTLRANVFWAVIISVAILELASVLWFWPSNPKFIAIYLGSVFYTFIGLSQVWLDRRLFRGVIGGYMVVFIIGLIFITFLTSWGN